MKTRMSDGMLLGNIREGKGEDVRKGFCAILTRFFEFVYFFLLFFFEIESVAYASWKFIIDINREIMFTLVKKVKRLLFFHEYLNTLMKIYFIL